MHVLVVLEELGDVDLQAAEQHYGSAFHVAHTVEELVELVHVRGLGGGQQLLRIGDEQNPVLQGGYLLVEVAQELRPVGCVHLFRRLLGHSGRHHLVGNQMGDEVLAGAGVSQDEAVQAHAGAAYELLRHLELFVEFVQHRGDLVFAYQPLLCGRCLKRAAAETAPACLRAIILSAILTGHILFVVLLCCSGCSF